jgi:hypothetical protein
MIRNGGSDASVFYEFVIHLRPAKTFKELLVLTRYFEMKIEPSFFLSAAGENEGLAAPRACWAKARLRDPVRDDHMLVEIEPPVMGQNYGLGNQDITNLILSARHKGFSLFPIKEWPCHVHVSRILDDAITESLTFTRAQIEIIAWGIIFQTLGEANAHAKKFQSP